MKHGLKILAAVGILAFSTVSVAHSETNGELDYLRSVMNIFRLHIHAIEQTIEPGSSYSDNVVRHAAAIRQTSGLLDHAYPGKDSKVNSRGHEWPWEDEEAFRERVSVSQDSAKELVSAAKKWNANHDTPNLLDAIEGVKQGCRNCHGDLRNWP
ncbi:MAG: cytochrome c [Magnetococcales bacterium]|nr:cytochrome c [Magnetococcales bacterium]